MFKEIEIKIGKAKLVISDCEYKTYKDITEAIQGFIDVCLTKELKKDKGLDLESFKELPF